MVNNNVYKHPVFEIIGNISVYEYIIYLASRNIYRYIYIGI